MKWEKYGISPTLSQQLIKCGFKKPTSVQEASLEHLRTNKDLLISARTGEGKTLTYAIPIINAFINGAQVSPLALVLSPTRELAIQIEANFKTVGKELGLKTCSIVGGLAAQKQLRVLTKGKPHVIVATPGRLWDLMNESNIPLLKELNKAKFVVIDEGDRMVESGHFRELQSILDYVYLSKWEVASAQKPIKVEDIEEIKTKKGESKKEDYGEFVEEKIELKSQDLNFGKGLSKEQLEAIYSAEDLNEGLNLENIEVEKIKEIEEMPEEEKQADSEAEDIDEDKKEGEENEDKEVEKDENNREEEIEKEEKEQRKKKPKKKAQKKVKNSYAKQTIVCSATLIFDSKGRFQHKLSKNQIKEVSKDRVRELFKKICFRGKPVTINLTDNNKLPDKLHEFYVHCAKEDKDLYLLYHLRETKTKSVIVFCNSITCCKRLQSILKMLKYKAFCLHSKMEQGQRLKSLDKFKKYHQEKKEKSVLICTDVGARGIDISDIEYIVHFQLPKYAEIYVHRCGRTARIYNEGNSLALIGPEDEKNYKGIVAIVRKKSGGTSEDQVEIEGARKYDVNYSTLSSLQKVVKKATELESTVHQLQKKRKEGEWLVKMAQEADIELDDIVVKENKELIAAYSEPEKKRLEAKKVKSIQREYEKEYKKADMGKMSKSSFLTPELVDQLNRVSSTAPIKPKKPERKRKPDFENKKQGKRGNKMNRKKAKGSRKRHK